MLYSICIFLINRLWWLLTEATANRYPFIFGSLTFISQRHRFISSDVPIITNEIHSMQHILLLSVKQFSSQTLKKKVFLRVGKMGLIHKFLICLCLIRNYLSVSKLNCLLHFLMILPRLFFWSNCLIFFQRSMQEACQDKIFLLSCAIFSVSTR